MRQVRSRLQFPTHACGVWTHTVLAAHLAENQPALLTCRAHHRHSHAHTCTHTRSHMLTCAHMGTLTCSHKCLHMHTLVHTPRSTNTLTHTVNAGTHMHARPCLHVHTQAHTHTCAPSQAHRDTCTRKNTLNSVSKPTGWLLCCLLPARPEAQLRKAASSCPSACLRLPIALRGFTRPLHLLAPGGRC